MPVLSMTCLYLQYVGSDSVVERSFVEYVYQDF